MSNIRKYKPGLLIACAAPDAFKTPGETLNVLNQAHQQNLYQAYQVLHIDDPKERKDLLNFKQTHNLELAYSLGRKTYTDKLNISDLNSEWRQKSIQVIKEEIEKAAEIEALNIQLLSGVAPDDPSKRTDAIERMAESLIELCQHTLKFSEDCYIILEPLDVTAHKKGTFGYLGEYQGLYQKVTAEVPNFGYTIDTAHMLLNHEDCKQGLTENKISTRQFHLCNCVTDQQHELFGDHHIELGDPGDLSIEIAADLVKHGINMGLFEQEYSPVVYIEHAIKNQPLDYALDIYTSYFNQIDHHLIQHSAQV